jgi:hypothetical protein
MSVMTNKAQHHQCCWTPESECLLCGRKMNIHPMLIWDDLFLCGPCCVEVDSERRSISDIPHHVARSRRNGPGLMADIIQIAAAKKIQDLGYPGTTLVRSTEQQEEQAERDHQEQMREWASRCDDDAEAQS